MGYESLNRIGRSTTTQVTFINDTPPVFVPPGSDPSGQNQGTWVPGSGHFQTQTTYGTAYLATGYRSSTNTTGFNSKNRQSLLKANSFDFSLTTFSSEGISTSWTTPLSVAVGPGSAGYRNDSVYTTNVTQFGSVTDPSASWLQTGSLQAKATSNLLKNLRDSAFNAAQAIGERKQTADLVAGTAKKVASSLRNLRKGNFARAASDLGVTPKKRAGRRFNSQFATDQAKATGNAWLELQYGWKPLLSDVYGAMETLAKANNPAGNPNTIYKKATGRAKRSEEPRTVTRTSLPAGYSGWDEVTRSGKTTVIVKTGVTYSLSSQPLASLKSVGITNPLLLAWELLPYSFVVDWFMPIGNYLESLDATNGLSFYDGYMSTFVRFEATTIASSSYSYNTGQQHFYRFVTENYKTVKFTRSRLGNFPSAPAPTFKNPLSTSHVASAMALLLQLKR